MESEMARWLRLAVLVALFSGVGCNRDKTDIPISEKPARSSEQTSMPDTPSSLALHLTIPYSVISSKLDDAFPKSVSMAGREPVCTNERVSVVDVIRGSLGDFSSITKTVRVCAPTDFRAMITRDAGPVSVSRADSGIHIGVPLRVEGNAGFTGDIARILRLHSKNFRATLVAHANVDVDIGDKWCPKVVVRPGFEWINKAELERRPPGFE